MLPTMCKTFQLWKNAPVWNGGTALKVEVMRGHEDLKFSFNMSGAASMLSVGEHALKS